MTKVDWLFTVLWTVKNITRLRHKRVKCFPLFLFVQVRLGLLLDVLCLCVTLFRYGNKETKKTSSEILRPKTDVGDVKAKLEDMMLGGKGAAREMMQRHSRNVATMGFGGFLSNLFPSHLPCSFYSRVFWIIKLLLLFLFVPRSQSVTVGRA